MKLFQLLACSFLIFCVDDLIRRVDAQEEGIRVVIKYTDDSFIDEAISNSIGSQLVANITRRRILAITVENQETIDRLRADDRVETIEEDVIQEILSIGPFEERDFFRIDGELRPDGEFVPYGVPMVQADQLWDIPPVQDDLVVCVVDTGLDLGHKDLPTREEDNVTGTSTLSGVWFNDGQGHGTHCAGTIGAVGDNGEGVVGIRKDPNLFRFHIGKGLSNQGAGYESQIIEAVEGCVESGARVVSMSLGGPGSTSIAETFYQDVYNDGVLIIAAAGNSGNTGDSFPASYPSVLSVAAVDANETRPEFSQCNSQVEIAAPGVDVLSTIPENRYGFSSGTSMACPHVAGVAAEVWSRFPECTNSQIRNVLLLSAKSIGEYGCYNGLGSGLIQAKAAYDLLASEGCSAGGAADAKPVGGCRQNPAFVESENPFFEECPDGAFRLSNVPILMWGLFMGLIYLLV